MGKAAETSAPLMHGIRSLCHRPFKPPDYRSGKTFRKPKKCWMRLGLSARKSTSPNLLSLFGNKISRPTPLFPARFSSGRTRFGSPKTASLASAPPHPKRGQGGWKKADLQKDFYTPRRKGDCDNSSEVTAIIRLALRICLFV